MTNIGSENQHGLSLVKVIGIPLNAVKTMFVIYKKIIWLPISIIGLAFTISFTLLDKVLQLVIGYDEYGRKEVCTSSWPIKNNSSLYATATTNADNFVSGYESDVDEPVKNNSTDDVTTTNSTNSEPSNDGLVLKTTFAESTQDIQEETRLFNTGSLTNSGTEGMIVYNRDIRKGDEELKPQLMESPDHLEQEHLLTGNKEPFEKCEEHCDSYEVSYRQNSENHVDDTFSESGESRKTFPRDAARVPATKNGLEDTRNSRGGCPQINLNRGLSRSYKEAILNYSPNDEFQFPSDGHPDSNCKDDITPNHTLTETTVDSANLSFESDITSHAEQDTIKNESRYQNGIPYTEMYCLYTPEGSSSDENHTDLLNNNTLTKQSEFAVQEDMFVQKVIREEEFINVVDKEIKDISVDDEKEIKDDFSDYEYDMKEDGVLVLENKVMKDKARHGHENKLQAGENINNRDELFTSERLQNLYENTKESNHVSEEMYNVSKTQLSVEADGARGEAAVHNHSRSNAHPRERSALSPTPHKTRKTKKKKKV